MTNVERYRTVERRFWQHHGLAPTERWITLTEGRVRVQVVGDGPPVVLVHGAPNAGSTWAPLLEHLPGFRCHVIDRPGAGLSDDFVLTGELHVYAERFLTRVLDALDLPQARVVASSFGGFLSLMAAAAAPGRVTRMLQMGCPAFAPGMLVPGFMRGMTLRPVRWLMNALPPNERVGRSILRQIGHGASLDADRIPPLFVEWYLALQRDTNTMRNDGEMIGRAGSLWGFPREYTMPDAVLRSVATPTLFLWGADDTFGGEAVARRVVELMPDASLTMFAGFGHLPWIDDPVTVGRATAEFLTG